MDEPETNQPEELPPEPEETGVSPDQQAAIVETLPAIIDQHSASGIRGVSMSGALARLPSGVTGHAAKLLLQVSTAQLEGELQQARRERDDARTSADEWKDKCLVEEKNVAVLTDRWETSRSLRLLRNALITLGTIVASVSVSTENWLATLLGATLLLMGWFWPERGPKVTR